MSAGASSSIQQHPAASAHMPCSVGSVGSSTTLELHASAAWADPASDGAEREVRLISPLWQAQYAPTFRDATPTTPMTHNRLPLSLVTHSDTHSPTGPDMALAFLFKCDKYFICERVVKDHEHAQRTLSWICNALINISKLYFPNPQLNHWEPAADLGRN